MTKLVSYTPEMEEQIKATYTAADTSEARDAAVEELARMLGKSVRMIAGKLVHMGIYISKTKRASASARVTKAELVDKIAARMGFDEAQAKSLSSANVSVLEGILDLIDSYDVALLEAMGKDFS